MSKKQALTALNSASPTFAISHLRCLKFIMADILTQLQTCLDQVSPAVDLILVASNVVPISSQPNSMQHSATSQPTTITLRQQLHLMSPTLPRHSPRSPEIQMHHQFPPPLPPRTQQVVGVLPLPRLKPHHPLLSNRRMDKLQESQLKTLLPSQIRPAHLPVDSESWLGI